MYTFSSKLKVFSFVLIVLGILGIGYSFLTAPKTIEDVEKILNEEAAHGHGGHHAEASHHDAEFTAHGPAAEESHEGHVEKAHGHEATADAHHAEAAHDHDEHHAHLEHVLHQLKK